MNKYEKALIDNLDDLVEAFHLVLNTIEEGDNNTEDCYSELISEDYPFKESFDELYIKVMDWRDTIKDLIKRNVIGDRNKFHKAKEIYNNIQSHLKLIDGSVCMYYILDTTDNYCYALVFNINTSIMYGTEVMGKIARQPINSLLQCDYDIDWLMPTYNNDYDIDDTEITIDNWEDILDLLEHYYENREYYFKYE